MNYLAHLYLASREGNARIGGLLGDFVRGDLKYEYSFDIQREIRIHILIDSYTDDHPTVRSAKKLVTERKRRYMGIALDVFYDHVLAVKWNDYSDLGLLKFVQESYRILLKNRAILPPDLARMLPFMIHDDWLTSYKDFAGFKRGVYRVSRLLRRGDLLRDCLSDFESNYDAFISSFDEFFPQLVSHVKEQRKILMMD